jgi:Kef-type K+ transport system membrane component KefB
MGSPFTLPELMSPISELLTVGAVMLLGLLGGKVARHFHIPKVTGYLVIGLVLGPSVLNLLGKAVIANVELVSDLALGMIMFAIGGVFELNHFRRVEHRLLRLSLAESAGSFVLVTLGAGALGMGWYPALLLGAISIATSPSVSLLVIREYDARGQLSDLLLSMVALNSVICILVFTFILHWGAITEAGGIFMALGWTVYEALGSVLVGGVVGWLLSQLEARVDDQAELLMVIVAGVLVAIGTAMTLRISPLMAALAVGAMTTNLSVMHRLAYVELRQTEQPLYIAFFVLSGAKLDIRAFASLGLLGIVYIIARGAGKYLGNFLSARTMGIAGPIRTHLGLALIPQAGVAIGLMRLASERYAHIGAIISAVILAAVIVYETLGPLVTRWAIFAAGEGKEQA